MMPLAPTDTVPLFRPLLHELVSLLRSLEAADWDRPTVARGWRVRDVAVHLLDGDLRRLSLARDGHRLTGSRPIESDRDLVELINGLNAGGVTYGSRLSARVITDLLEVTGEWVANLFAALPPDGPAAFPVSWAGEDTSPNWMDVGRDYTERWHHQMQIRDAVSTPRLLDPRWMEPLLDLSVRALPRAYAGTPAPEGTTVTLSVRGETTGDWTVVRERGWTVKRGRPPVPSAVATVSTDDVWRLLYNALPTEDASRRVRIEGDRTLVEPMLEARSVIV